DLLLGAVVAKEDSPMLNRLRIWQHAKGAVPSSFDCWLALRGVQSLSARMSVHCSNAKVIAEFLSQHEKVEVVHYRGLPSHPGHSIAAEQMRAFSGLMSFQVKANHSDALQIANPVNIFTQSTSLGSTLSHIEHRARVDQELT